jgi:hypothetical protein
MTSQRQRLDDEARLHFGKSLVDCSWSELERLRALVQVEPELRERGGGRS